MVCEPKNPLQNIRNIKRVITVKSISFDFLTYLLYRDARLLHGNDSQQGNTIHDTAGREMSALNMSGIIDSQLYNRFNR